MDKRVPCLSVPTRRYPLRASSSAPASQWSPLSIALPTHSSQGGSNSINPMQEAHHPWMVDQHSAGTHLPLSTSLCPAFGTVSAFLPPLGESINAVPTTTNYANYVGGLLSGSSPAGTFQHTPSSTCVSGPPTPALQLGCHYTVCFWVCHCGLREGSHQV